MNSTQQKAYAAGYQDALADIRNALHENGLDGVWTWLADNQSVGTEPDTAPALKPAGYYHG